MREPTCKVWATRFHGACVGGKKQINQEILNLVDDSGFGWMAVKALDACQ